MAFGLAASALAEVPDRPALGLETVLARTDAYFPKALAADLERQIAVGKLIEKQGAFDPTLTLKGEELRYLDATGDVAKEKGQVAFEVPSRSGITWFGGARISEARIVGKAGTKDFERTFLGLKVPLLRDARINAKLAAERQASIGVEIARAERDRIRLELLRKAGEAYWKWIAAARSREVAVEMVDLALRRAEALTEVAARGDIPELVAVEAEIEVQRRREALSKAIQALDKASLGLSLYLWTPEGEPEDPPPPDRIPASLPPPTALTPGEVLQAEETARARRPEFALLEGHRRTADIERALAENDGSVGLELFLNPGRESEADVFEPLERRLRAGFKLTVPLRRRGPRGRGLSATGKLEKLELETRLLRQQLNLDVRTVARVIATDLERLEAATREVELARRLEAGERTGFELGEGTLFLVNQRERARAEAERKKIEIDLDYRLARLSLDAITGVLLPPTEPQ